MVIHGLLFLCTLTLTAQQQRLAPGVAPQQYQQPPPPPAQHQQQYQQQQIPQFQQQLPQQPQQFQQQQQQDIPVQHHVPVQHIPVQNQVPAQHHGDHGFHNSQGAPGQILNAANMVHEKEHLAEHLSVPIDTSKMTEQELQFHYFKMHDADNNNKLDGCELIKSLIHWHGEDNDKKSDGQVLIQTDLDLSSLVDPILKDNDENQNGYIEWAEFLKSLAK